MVSHSALHTAVVTGSSSSPSGDHCAVWGAMEVMAHCARACVLL